MKNLAAVSLLLFLSVCSTRVASAQTRARRVEQTVPAPSSPTPSSSTNNPPANAGETASPPKSLPNAPPDNESPAPLPAGAQEEVGEGEVVHVSTTLVSVPVSVMDRDGKYIADLNKEDFRLFENGVEQQVAYFAAVERPFTVVLMLDTSASTWSKLGQIKDAAKAFVEQLRPDDQVMVVSFARGLTVKCEATIDRQKIRKAIEGTGRGLSTHLYDAMEKLMSKHLKGIQGRKAVVLFTDGVDAKSKDATYESSVHTAEELDALIYPIVYDTYDRKSDQSNAPAPGTTSRLPSIFGKIPLPFPMPTQGNGTGGSGGTGSSRADYDLGERYLHDLAELTGGRVYEARKDLSYLRAAFNYIAEELRRQYSLGYYPRQMAQPGERRNIKVRVNRTDLAVRARDSYIYKPSIPASSSTVNKAKTGEQETTSPVLQKKPFTQANDHPQITQIKNQ
jgi:Ca-activated chloride channel homolog